MNYFASNRRLTRPLSALILTLGLAATPALGLAQQAAPAEPAANAQPGATTRVSAEPVPAAVTPDQDPAAQAPAEKAAAEKAPAVDSPAQPRSLGPFTIENEAGNSLKLGVVSQLLFTLRRDKLGEDEGVEDQLAFRRLRLVFDGKHWDDQLRTKLQINVAPGALELMDMWAESRPRKGLAVRVGQHTVPFTEYRQLSFRQVPLVDWPITTYYFGAERQLGATGFFERDRLKLAAGVFTGASQRASHGVGIARVYGEAPVNRSSLVNPAPPAEMQPELMLRATHTSKVAPPLGVRDDEGGALRYLAAGSLAWDVRPEDRRDNPFRAALETRLAAHHVGLNFIGYFATFKPEAGGFKAGMLGALAEFSVRPVAWIDFVGRYALVQHLASLRSEARTYGQAQIAAADPAELEQVEATYGKAGANLREHETALGFNVHIIPGDLFKWQNDVAVLSTEGNGDTRHDLRVRSMLMLAL